MATAKRRQSLLSALVKTKKIHVIPFGQNSDNSRDPVWSTQRQSSLYTLVKTATILMIHFAQNSDNPRDTLSSKRRQSP